MLRCSTRGQHKVGDPNRSSANGADVDGAVLKQKKERKRNRAGKPPGHNVIGVCLVK